jgi:hypothetical protein
MRLELTALDTLRSYCKIADGNYPPPTDIFSLGPPDLPIKNIEVNSVQWDKPLVVIKAIRWWYPYKRFGFENRPELFVYFCRDWIRPDVDEETLYREGRASITNGNQQKELFDCKRGLRGEFVMVEEAPGRRVFVPSDPEKVHLEFVKPGSDIDLWYRGICLRVIHEKPYSPE